MARCVKKHASQRSSSASPFPLTSKVAGVSLQRKHGVDPSAEAQSSRQSAPLACMCSLPFSEQSALNNVFVVLVPPSFGFADF